VTDQAMVEELRSHLESLARWSLYDWKHNRNSPSCEGRYHGALRMLELFDALHARQGQEPPK
jgi:hypothetical protein